MLAAVLFFVGEKDEDEEPPVEDEESFDALAGGYPVPPMSSAHQTNLTRSVGKAE